MINYPDNIRVYDNYLAENVAQALYSKLSGIPQQWFSLRKTSHPEEGSKPKFSKTWWSLHGDKSTASQLDLNGEMTYQYMATDMHQSGCDCAYCDLNKLFNQQPPPEVSDLVMQESFLSLYRPGDFLSQHTDIGAQRQWAFTYTLSTGWRPEYGGILNVKSDGIWYAFPPTFNRLILIDVTDKASCVHFVSQVIPQSPINRITYSGWWYDPKTGKMAA